MKSKGLGDSIEKVTKVIGVKRIVDTISKITGKDCGCNTRKKALNEMWTYSEKLEKVDNVVFKEEEIKI